MVSLLVPLRFAWGRLLAMVAQGSDKGHADACGELVGSLMVYWEDRVSRGRVFIFGRGCLYNLGLDVGESLGFVQLSIMCGTVFVELGWALLGIMVGFKQVFGLGLYVRHVR